MVFLILSLAATPLARRRARGTAPSPRTWHPAPWTRGGTAASPTARE
ncbi:hypothetical protein ACFQVA_11160 [Actinomadura keratinilytica]